MGLSPSRVQAAVGPPMVYCSLRLALAHSPRSLRRPGPVQGLRRASKKAPTLGRRRFGGMRGDAATFDVRKQPLALGAVRRLDIAELLVQ